MDSKQIMELSKKIRKGYTPGQYLSENSKTCVSINLPIQGHCKPTKRCLQDCYGKSGHTALPGNLRKQRFMSKCLEKQDLTHLIQECLVYSSVRLNGIGDMNPSHLPAIFSLAKACPQTEFWGMTRKVSIANRVNGKSLENLSLLVSVDTTSPKAVWKYPGALCFGPRRPEDKVPNDKRIVTVFPRHHAGRVIGNVPSHPKDCPAVRHTISGCVECQQCWDWK